MKLSRTCTAIAITFFIGHCYASAEDTSCKIGQMPTADYDVYWGNLMVGAGSISVATDSAQTNPQCYVMKQLAKPRRILRWLTGPITEVSHFCLSDDGKNIVPARYEYSVEGRNADKSYSLTFTQDGKSVSGSKLQPTQLEVPALDPLALQLSLRQWLCELSKANSSPVSDEIELPVFRRSSLSVYRFQASKTVEKETQSSLWLVERVDSKERQLKFWLDPRRDFLLLKASHSEEDKKPVRMEWRPSQ